MARLDLYQMPGGGSGYLLNVQADLLSQLSTRTVIPLLPQAKAPRPIAGLNPVFDVGGSPHVMITQAIASIPERALKHPVGSLDAQHDTIIRALDILILGL